MAVTGKFELIVLLHNVQELSDQYWNELFYSVRLMDEKAWVGPSARAFDQEVQRNHRSLQAQLRKAVDLLNRAVMSAPGMHA